MDVRVLKSTPIKTDTVASLKLQGITGVVFIELTGGSPKAHLLSEGYMPFDVPEIFRQPGPGHLDLQAAAAALQLGRFGHLLSLGK